MKRYVIALLMICGFLMVGVTSAQKAPGGGVNGTAPGQWVIMTYTPDNGYTVPVPFKASPVKGGGVSFAFLPTPDRSMLLTEITKNQDKDFTGLTFSAKIAISATAGAVFNYCGPNCDGTDPGGFVRFYFYGANPALAGCEPGWHPERPDCEAQYWWSNPVAIDLDDLVLLGKGTTLVAPLSPAFWSDRDGHVATDVVTINGITVDHSVAFAASVANITKMGLSFGGGNNFAFGAGVTAPATATFVLYNFAVK
jgi:hypothetical protein